MKKHLLLFSLSLITVFLVCSSDSHCQTQSFTARVSYVADGDSLVVKVDGRKIRIRLWGIDAPEEGQSYSREAERLTKQLIFGRLVTIVPVERDDYGRLVANVFVGQKNVSEELVRSGLAWVHIYYCRKWICRSWRVLEENARREQRGLWAGDSYVAPWEWKRQKRSRRTGRQ